MIFMNLRTNKGSGFLETLIVLPIFMSLFFAFIYFTFIDLSKKIVLWTCFKTTRMLFAHPEETSLAIQKAREMLRLIPFPQTEPIIRIENSNTDIKIECHQTISILGKYYDLKETIAMYR